MLRVHHCLLCEANERAMDSTIPICHMGSFCSTHLWANWNSWVTSFQNVKMRTVQKMHFYHSDLWYGWYTHADSFLRQCHQSFDPNMQPAVPRSRNQQPKDWDMHRAFKRCCLTLMVLSLPARHLCFIAQRAWERDTLRWRLRITWPTLT
jgi:hypothetical protein